MTDPQMPVQYAKGVGPKIAAKLAKLGIVTLADLLQYYPREWEDRRLSGPLRESKVDMPFAFRGTVQTATFTETGGGMAVVTAVLKEKTDELLCKWIRKRSFKYDVLETFRKELVAGKSVMVFGKIERDFAGKVMSVEEHAVMTGSKDDFVHVGRIVPIYALTKGLRPRLIRKLVYDFVDRVALPDPLPPAVVKAQGLMPLASAIKKVHFPEGFAEKENARKRLAFQEFFMIQTVLSLVRNKNRQSRGHKYEIKKDLLTPFREKCGFEFTRSQKKVIRDIFADLTSDFPMNRLLQGDVGSGKTVVALSAMLLACENRYQSALMAPTEILAEQHYITLKHFIGPLPVNVGLLTGSVKGKERKKLLDACGKGKIDIMVGTHALLEKEVQFSKLGLLVIDEQHRFGVRHRLTLAQRNTAPDVLVMTATPIPRTLAMGLYGDLDTSMISELPPGRQKINTMVRTERESYAFVKNEVRKGHQAYIVYPLVDESSKIELKAAMKEFERLKNGVFKGCSVGLLHGQMPSSQKEKIMTEFHNGKFSILVSTTVIEVGIDVPNATVMVIQDAERFGLSTLHQLRGRTGRGKDPSYCILIPQKSSKGTNPRMEILLKTSNGFELAEADLELRGPGEVFGTTQHGIPPR